MLSARKASNIRYYQIFVCAIKCQVLNVESRDKMSSIK